MLINSRKVGLVGTGMVGSSFAYSLVQSGLANELVLIDVNKARSEGEALDLEHGLAFVESMKIFSGEYSDLAGAAVTVVCGGVAQKPGETRLQLLEKNAGIFRQVIPEIVKANPEGIILIATNPVDILTYISATESGLAANKVIGSGTILDTARLRYMVGAHFSVDPKSVHAYVLGEHGDSEFPAWSTALIGGVPLKQFKTKNNLANDQAALDLIFENTKKAAYNIIEKKGATYYAIGLGLVEIVRAILRDQHTVLPVSSLLTGEMGVSEVCISLPVVVGAKGVEQVLELPLDKNELEKFTASASLLKERFAELK